eukprot:9500740-Pyramimonas_sp.AAC.2
MEVAPDNLPSLCLVRNATVRGALPKVSGGFPEVSGFKITRVVSVISLGRERDCQPGELGDAHAVGGQLHNKRRSPPEGGDALDPT